MKIVTIIAQALLGLVFVVFGFNGFFHFLPMPPLSTDTPAGMFLTAVSTSGYMKAVFLCQIVGGLLLLLNILPVLGLVILCPVIFNIVLFHLTMAPANLGIPIGVAVLAVFLVGMHWKHLSHIVRQPR
ncbi:MAG: hypothetical protein ABI217_12700 [Chthoniobacterales bacterium]